MNNNFIVVSLLKKLIDTCLNFLLTIFLPVPTRAPTSVLSCYTGSSVSYSTATVPAGNVCITYCISGITYYSNILAYYGPNYAYSCSTDNCNLVAITCTSSPTAIPTSGEFKLMNWHVVHIYSYVALLISSLPSTAIPTAVPTGEWASGIHW